jgi:Rieske Fe-S protein
LVGDRRPHNANFDLSGAVLGGPTMIPLPVYAASVGPDAITVDLS